VREYLSYVRTRPRYEGHPTTPSNSQTVSAYTYRHQAVVLRVFARWLETEEYTAEHRLQRLKTPKVPETIVDILTAEEIQKILDFAPSRTPIASRNHAMLVLALDTGMRMSEILTLERRNLDIDQGILTAFGKGAKERMVPFGFMASKSLQRYLLHFRPEPAAPIRLRVPPGERLAGDEGRDGPARKARGAQDRRQPFSLAPHAAHFRRELPGQRRGPVLSPTNPRPHDTRDGTPLHAPRRFPRAPPAPPLLPDGRHGRRAW
jgi:integrase